MVRIDMLASPAEVNALLDEQEVDVLVATSLKNVYYTSGIWTTPTITPGDENYTKTGLYADYSPPKSIAIWPIGADEPMVIIPPVVTLHIPDEGIEIADENIYIFGHRSMDPAQGDHDISPGIERAFNLFETTYDDRAAALEAALDGHIDGDTTIAIENQTASSGPTDDASYVKQVVDSRLNPASIVEGTRLFQKLRLTKTDEEIRRLREAAEVTESVIMDSLDLLEPGITEKEYAVKCKQMIYERGGIEQLWLDHNHIGFGHRTAYVHVVPNENKILEPGDLIRFEFGGRFEHYPSDLARTFIYGEQDEEIATRYRVINAGMTRAYDLLAEHADTDVIMEGAMTALRERAAEEGVDDLADFDAAVLGHNMGLDIHDPPLLSYRKAPIEPGMVMNYEIMATQWGVGGIQIEDTALITEDGIASFSRRPDELLVVE